LLLRLRHHYLLVDQAAQNLLLRLLGLSLIHGAQPRQGEIDLMHGDLAAVHLGCDLCFFFRLAFLAAGGDRGG
jgi:hypothetical protein